MTARDPRVDACIARSALLARPMTMNAAAMRTFDAFAPRHRREYVAWITEAKRPDTRARRMAWTIGPLADGKAPHWKYASHRTASGSVGAA
jgi:hypothetical protein